MGDLLGITKLIRGCKPETPNIPPENVRSEVSGHRINPTLFPAHVLPGLERRLPPIVGHVEKHMFGVDPRQGRP